MSDMPMSTYSQAKSPWLSLFPLGLLLSIATIPAWGKEPPPSPPSAGHRPQAAAIDAMALLEQRLVKMGTINQGQLSVVLENLHEPDSLGYLKDYAQTGLVISVFVDSSDEKSVVNEGELARAVRDRLKAISPQASARVGKFIDGLSSRKPGDVAGFTLGLAKEQRAGFSIDRLIAVIFEQGHSSESAPFLGQAMAGVMADAEHEHLAALVVPCIGHRWQEKHSLTFEQVFQPLFKALEGSKQPLEVFVSLYSVWPTFVIEDAVGALNHTWTGSPATGGGRPTSQLMPSGVTRPVSALD